MAADVPVPGEPGRVDAARRQFLKVAGAVGAGAAAAAGVARGQTEDAPAPGPVGRGGEMPMRAFGRHGDVKISALGMGGHHLGDVKTVDEAIDLVHTAVDGGITFFDNCWEYYNGKTENWLGRALRGRRDKVFLMTKVCTHGRDASLAMRMLEESLVRLETDHLDLWQLHGMVFDNDPELAYRKGGAIEALEQAKKEGKARFVGFTGHKDPGVHFRMIELGYPFDSVQMPLNCFDATFLSFEQRVLPEATKRGIAVLGMKPMGGTADAIKQGVVKADEMLRYAMSLPVATTISGMNSRRDLENNLGVARGFKPMSPGEMDDLRKRCADMAGDGRFEVYKSTLKFDNPEARLAHRYPIDPQQKEVKQMFEDTMSPTPQ
jgi:predicted aldo/keto reductase-like oxidoreductase